MPPLVPTGLRPLPGRVGVALLVCGFETSRREPCAITLPCARSNLPGSGALMGDGDGRCGFVSGGRCGRARVGTQDPDEMHICAIHFGRLRGRKGTASPLTNAMSEFLVSRVSLGQARSTI